MMSIRIDTTDWPIVVHVSEGESGEAAVDTYIREATAILRDGSPHAVIMDASMLSLATPYARARKKVWLTENAELLRRSCVCTAMVLTSPLARFAAATVMLVHPFPTPYRIFATHEEARAWARLQLSARGLPEPA